jgi:hypothetical protein
MLQKTDIPMGRINAFLFFYQVDLFFILYISCNKKPWKKHCVDPDRRRVFCANER